jgi:hypothetical protein
MFNKNKIKRLEGRLSLLNAEINNSQQDLGADLKQLRKELFGEPYPDSAFYMGGNGSMRSGTIPQRERGVIGRLEDYLKIKWMKEEGYKSIPPTPEEELRGRQV